MAKSGRSIWGMVWKNFVNSLKPKQLTGNLMGVDYNGTRYFEIPADPQSGKRYPSRWFTPKGGEAEFDKEIPAEWEAWLRNRRLEPPTEEEVMKNLRIMKMTRLNAAEIDKKFAKPKLDDVHNVKKGFDSFPKYDEFELHPGKKCDKK